SNTSYHVTLNPLSQTEKYMVGYGPRLFNMHGSYNQLQNVINLLQEKNLPDVQ
ncbi:hypothetical protein HMPREF0358_2024, partial [Escherichia coli 83972]